jgi:hypothetical protein
MLIAAPATGQLLFTEGGDRGENPQMGDLASKYAGKIVFSEQQLTFARTNEDMLKSSFQMMDNIYARVFLKKTFEEYFDEYDYKAEFITGASQEVFHTPKPGSRQQYKLLITIDNTYHAVWLDRLQGDEAFRNYTTYQFVLLPSERQQEEYARMANWWVNLLARLSPGEHTVRLELIPVDPAHLTDRSPVLAKGEFTFTIEEGRINEFVDEKAPGLPEATMVDATLEGRMQALIAAAHDEEYAAFGDVIITDINGGWNNIYSEGGQLLSREIVASYLVKDFEGKCWVQSKTFAENWLEEEEAFDDFNIRGVPNGYYHYQILCEKTNLSGEKPELEFPTKDD